MINYFNFEKTDNGYLITNDLGYYSFISEEVFGMLLRDSVPDSIPEYAELCEKYFVSSEHEEVFSQNAADWLRSIKSYCFGCTALHIFAVTNACNLRCVYCQAHVESSDMTKMMTEETGVRAIDIALSSPNNGITLEFQGGEPLLNYPVVKKMIEHCETSKGNKTVNYTIVTNLTLLTDEMLDFFIANQVSICTSLDGDRLVHNHNRPYISGKGSYDDVIGKIKYLCGKGIRVGAIQTTTRFSLDHWREIIDQYVQCNMDAIFLRPLTPLGMASEKTRSFRYSAEEFLQFYKSSFDYIMELNLSGTRFVELHAGFFLKKILGRFSDNYMELRSPCGAGIGQMSYYWDGNVYTCDEGRMLAEMGDRSFLLGNVWNSDFHSLVNSPVCRAVCKASVVESLPKCGDCVYQPYCGDCPVVNYAYDKDLYSDEGRLFRCKVYKGILDILFEVIHENDERKMKVLYSWIN